MIPVREKATPPTVNDSSNGEQLDLINKCEKELTFLSGGR